MRNPVARSELVREVEALPEHAGVNVQYPGGYRIRLARAGGFNLRYKPVLLEEIAPHRLAFAAEEVSDDVAHAILARAMARACILELEGPEGTPDAADADAVAAWLLEDEERLLDLQAVAEDPENFSGERREYA